MDVLVELDIQPTLTHGEDELFLEARSDANHSLGAHAFAEVVAETFPQWELSWVFGVHDDDVLEANWLETGQECDCNPDGTHLHWLMRPTGGEDARTAYERFESQTASQRGF